MPKATDFTGINPARVNAIVRIIEEYFNEYDIKPIGFVGSGAVHNSDFLNKNPDAFAWVEVDEENCVSAICFTNTDKIDTSFLVHHELYHVLDCNFGITSDFTGDSELLADAWAEYKTSEEPSETAVAVGKFIENKFRKPCFCAN